MGPRCLCMQCGLQHSRRELAIGLGGANFVCDASQLVFAGGAASGAVGASRLKLIAGFQRYEKGVSSVVGANLGPCSRG